jgi:hypothetical protein
MESFSNQDGQKESGQMSSNEAESLVPDPTVVQRSALASASHQLPKPPGRERRDIIISLRLTKSLVESVEDYQRRYRKRARTDAIFELLETALYIMDNVQRLDDPALVKYFRENLYNVQLVDDIMDWPQDRIEAVIGVLASERERRFRLKIGKS